MCDDNSLSDNDQLLKETSYFNVNDFDIQKAYLQYLL